MGTYVTRTEEVLALQLTQDLMVAGHCAAEKGDWLVVHPDGRQERLLDADFQARYVPKPVLPPLSLPDLWREGLQRVPHGVQPPYTINCAGVGAETAYFSGGGPRVTAGPWNSLYTRQDDFKAWYAATERNTL